MDLHFCPQEKGQALSYPTFAHVSLKAYGSSPRGAKGHRDLVLLTPECTSIQEWDAQIDRLNRELETVRQQGRERFAKDGIA